ncbi:MAG: O-antigen ligase family protein [Paracoccus sp. (in: a-proteobacteria)]|uniref:O-antigen ligase family protein n=1 Tax=Paracoccus sp. TaxID=267 RepID=UPI0039E3EA28
MVAVTASPMILPAGFRVPGVGQRVYWLAYDWALICLTILAMSELFSRWHMGSIAWLAVYSMFMARVAMIWRSYYVMVTRNWQLLLYPAVCLASVVWSGSRSTSLVSGVQVTMTMLIAIYLGWRFTPRQVVLVLWGLLSAVSFMSVANWLTGALQPVYADSGGLLGLYTNKNLLGHFSHVAVLLSVTVLLMRPDQVRTWLRWLTPASFVFGAICVVLSQSMTAMLLMPCYIVLLLLLNRQRLHPALRYGGIALGVLGLGLGPLLLSIAGIDPLGEFFRATGKSSTLTGRTELWSIAAHVAAQAPLIGFGYGGFWQMPQYAAEHYGVLRAGATVPSFHNFMADIMVGTGLIGLSAMFVLIGTALRRGYRYYRVSGSALSVSCFLLLVLAVNVSLVEPFLFRQHEFMLTCMAILATSIAAHAPPFIHYPSRQGRGGEGE